MLLHGGLEGAVQRDGAAVRRLGNAVAHRGPLPGREFGGRRRDAFFARHAPAYFVERYGDERGAETAAHNFGRVRTGHEPARGFADLADALCGKQLVGPEGGRRAGNRAEGVRVALPVHEVEPPGDAVLAEARQDFERGGQGVVARVGDEEDGARPAGVPPRGDAAEDFFFDAAGLHEPEGHRAGGRQRPLRRRAAEGAEGAVDGAGGGFERAGVVQGGCDGNVREGHAYLSFRQGV